MKPYKKSLKHCFPVIAGILSGVLLYKAALFKDSAGSTVLFCIKSRKIMNSEFTACPFEQAPGCFCCIALSPVTPVYIVAYLIRIVLFRPFKAYIANDLAVLFQHNRILIVIGNPFLYALPNGKIIGVDGSNRFFLFNVKTHEIETTNNVEYGSVVGAQGPRIFMADGDKIYILLNTGLGLLDTEKCSISKFYNMPDRISTGGGIRNGVFYYISDVNWKSAVIQ